MEENKFQHQEMIQPKLDLIREKEGLDFHIKKKKFNLFLKIFLSLLAFGAVLASIFSYKAMSLSKDIFQSETKQSSILSQLKRLILSGDKKIKGEKDGRTNILLLGMGGEGHNGALLTDTIMVVSIKHDPKKVALISIPRDLAYPFEGDNYYKINAIYARKIENTTGNQQQNEKEAGNAISSTISQVLGIPIHYYIRADFEGFEKIINQLGGIDLEVQNSFYDSQYPTNDFGYQTISFQKGSQHLNGEKALQYARSRHGIITEGKGEEGSDFARAKRQQQIIEAIKEKAFSVFTLINPKKIHDILKTLGDHVRTNLEPYEMLRLIDFARGIERDKIINKVIDDQDNNLLYSTTSPYGAYILLPKKEDFSEIQSFARNIFDKNETQKEKIKIIVLNGTEISHLAQKYAKKLKRENYNVIFVDNSTVQDYEKTVIYNKIKHAHPYELKSLRDELNANISLNIPKEIKENDEIKNLEWDIIIILGGNVGEPVIELESPSPKP